MPAQSGIHLSEPRRAPPFRGRDTPDAIRTSSPRRHTLSCTKPSFPCPLDCSRGGGLLPRLFTLARRRFVFCGTVHTRGFAPRIPVFQPGLCSAVPGLSSREKSLQRMPAACQNLSKNSINQNYLAKNSLMQSHTYDCSASVIEAYMGSLSIVWAIFSTTGKLAGCGLNFRAIGHVCKGW